MKTSLKLYSLNFTLFNFKEEWRFRCNAVNIDTLIQAKTDNMMDKRGKEEEKEKEGKNRKRR